MTDLSNKKGRQTMVAISPRGLDLKRPDWGIKLLDLKDPFRRKPVRQNVMVRGRVHADMYLASTFCGNALGSAEGKGSAGELRIHSQGVRRRHLRSHG